MTIFIHRYQLIRKLAANSQTQNLTQEGCLVKITDQENNFGVADLCPWPSLGDLSLEQELAKQGPLFQRALELADKDLHARKNKLSLISNVELKNHIFISDYKNFDFRTVDKDGVVKIKCDSNIFDLAQILNRISNLKIRLDFNFCISENKFRKFLDLLLPEVLKKIDVIEDPFAFDQKSWTELNQKVTLALDWNFNRHQWQNLICKPSRSMTDSFLYMTSAMDHPVGVAHGIAIAQNYPNLVHGFATNDLYHSSGYEESEGYGIGFEKQISMITWEPWLDWSEQSENQLLINPKLPLSEKNILYELAQEFDNQVSKKNYFLIPSSGSSKSVDQSVKLIALKKSAILNSAERINQQFHFTQDMNWGCVLPTYHVAGLGILARAYLSRAKVFLTDWKNIFSNDIYDWIRKNKIQIISLVPAQIYDLVQKNILCPDIVKFAFVGGSELSTVLAEKATMLGWPVIQTYGMTETASMIAFKSDYKNNFFEPIQGVKILNSSVYCNSLASYAVQKNKDEIFIQKFSDFISLPDKVEMIEGRLRLLDRSNERIQILSETVSMSELRSHLEIVLIEMNLNIHQFTLIVSPDERSENKILLICEEVHLGVIEKFNFQRRPYEKIRGYFVVKKIPRTDLGKVKYQELIDWVQNQ